MQEKSKLSILLGKELNFQKVSKLIFITFCITFFSAIMMYLYGLLSQLVYPGSIELWVGAICLSTMFGFAISNYMVSKEIDNIKDELIDLRCNLAEAKLKSNDDNEVSHL